SVYGRFTDRDVYRAILDGNPECFRRLAAELAAALVHEDIEVVAGDEAEGYNPSHDLIRLIANAAVAPVQHITRASIRNPPVPPPARRGAVARRPAGGRGVGPARRRGAAPEAGGGPRLPGAEGRGRGGGRRRRGRGVPGGVPAPGREHRVPLPSGALLRAA